MWRWFRWVLLGIGIIIIGGAIFTFQYMRLSIFTNIDVDNPPKFIQADFVELDKVYAISKFRSGVGHDYSANKGEDCRSMKHYFSSMDKDQPNYKAQNLEMKDWPRPVEGKDVTLFSPVDGTISRVEHQAEKGWVGDEVKIVPDSYPRIIIRLMHVTPINDSIKAGKSVKAGEKVGLVLANQSFDLAIDQNALIDSLNISYFAAMPDSVFAKYQARGVKSREDLIITKEYRDAHPLQCANDSIGSFVNSGDTPQFEAENMVYLSGYDEIHAVTLEKWYNKNNKE